MKRKTRSFFPKSFLLGLVLFGGVLFVFRDRTLEMAASWSLKRAFPHLVYERLRVGGNRLVFSLPQIEEERIKCSAANVQIDLSIGKLLKSPKNVYQLFWNPKRDWKETLLAMHASDAKLSIRNGVLEFDGHSYYFDYESGKKADEIGRIRVFKEPGLKYDSSLFIFFIALGNQLLLQAQAEDFPCSELMELSDLVFPDLIEGLVGQGGKVDLDLCVIMGQASYLEGLSGRLSCEDVEIHSRRKNLLIGAESLTLEIHYPENFASALFPIWKKTRCIIDVEGGSFHLADQLSLTHLEGGLKLEPLREPFLNLQGELIEGDRALALDLNGKGAFHRDESYWLEFDLNVQDGEGTHCDTFLSICRPEKGQLAFQLEAGQLLPKQIKMVKNYLSKYTPWLEPWEVEQGVFGGKFIALLEKGSLSQLEIEGLQGENVALSKGDTPLFLRELKGGGRIGGELSFEAKLPIAHCFGLITPTWGKIYSAYDPDSLGHLSLSTTFIEGGLEVNASLDCIDQGQSIHFGFSSGPSFPSSIGEISSAWIRSERLDHHIYGPFLSSVEDLKIFGEIDLIGSYEKGVVQCALQIDHFLAKHPVVDIRIDRVGEKGKREKRATLSYDLATKNLEGVLPLDGGVAYDRTYGLLFSQLEGDLALDNCSVRCALRNGNLSFDQTPLMKNLYGNISLSQHPKFSQFSGDLVIDSDHLLQITIDHLDKNSCAMGLVYNQNPVAQFSGQYDQEWTGVLQLEKWDTPCHLAWNWDPKTGESELRGEGKDIFFNGHKRGNEYAIEKLKVGDLLGEAVFSFQDGEIDFAYMDIEQKGVKCQGFGRCYIDMPSSRQTFGLRGDLEMNITLPFHPEELKGKHPIKVVFIPDAYLLLSNLSFEGEGGSLRIDNLQYAFQPSQVDIHGFSCVLSPYLRDILIQEGILPQLFEEVTLFPQIKSTGNLHYLPGQLYLDGAFDTILGPLHFRAEKAKGGIELALGDKESLIVQSRLEHGRVYLEKVFGSLGNFSADLKRKGGHLKGVAAVDLREIGPLYRSNLSSFFDPFDFGGMCTFKGLFSPPSFSLSIPSSAWEFKGKLALDNLEWMGYRVRAIESRVDISSDQIIFENFDLNDDGGKVWMEEGILTNQEGEWAFSIPSIEVRSFQPSFISKVDGKEEMINPLIIKKANVEGFEGVLGDKESIKAIGTLRFTNYMKKKSVSPPSNLPIETFNQMGLDPRLFVPEEGEIDIAIQNGRCYLRKVRKMMGGHRQSEFFLPSSGVMGYLGLDGGLFLDFQVRQKAAPSIKGPISLKVRGTWDNPKMTIK